MVRITGCIPVHWNYRNKKRRKPLFWLFFYITLYNSSCEGGDNISFTPFAKV